MDVSELAVRIEMQTGELDDGGTTTTTAVRRARRALGTNDSIELKFPHIARFDASTFDTDAEGRPGYTATLFWRDEAGKRWQRTGGGPHVPGEGLPRGDVGRSGPEVGGRQ